MKPWIDLIAACLTPLIAIIATYIAYQQYRANRLKNRHDLYDRRLAVYNAVAEFLAHAMREGTADHAQLITLLQKTRESYSFSAPKFPRTSPTSTRRESIWSITRSS